MKLALILLMGLVTFNLAIARDLTIIEHNCLHKANDSSLFTLGGTYDSMSRTPAYANTCLNVSSKIENWQISNPGASIDFTQNQDLVSVERVLGVELASQIKVGPIALRTYYAYASSSQKDDYTLNINYIYQYTSYVKFKDNLLIQGKTALDSAALASLSSPKLFRQRCGDNAIMQLDANSSVLMRLSLKFNSIVEKSYYEESFKQLGGLQNILAQIQLNPHKVAFKLSAAGIQVGGNAQLLNDLFMAYGGTLDKEGYPILECGSDSNINANCSKLIDQVINYAGSVKQQLNTIEDFYLLNPRLASWHELGIDVKQIIPKPEIVNAIHEITRQNLIDLADLNFITNYKNMLISKNLFAPNLLEKINLLIDSYQRVVKLYADPKLQLADCFNGYVGRECLISYKKFITQKEAILADVSLKQLLTYLKTNQYLIQLAISPNLLNYSSCILSPISLDNLYMLNCNGQVGGSLEPLQGIKLIKASNQLLINNLAYIYNQNGINTSFKYIFNQAFQVDSLNTNLYATPAKIINLTEDIAAIQTVMITNIY